MPHTMDERRDLLEMVPRKLVTELGTSMDFLKAHGIGVTIFAFELNIAPSAIAYISNAERDGMIEALKEFLAFQEAGLTTEPRGERATT